MMNETNEKYKHYLGSSVLIQKKNYHNPNKPYFYKGVIVQVDETNLVIDDRKVGHVILSFDVIESIETKFEAKDEY